MDKGDKEVTRPTWEAREALVGGGMERGLSQKGSAGGRGVKEKSVNALNKKVATDGVVPSIIGNSGNIEKEVVSPSLSLKDTNVMGPFPPLPTHGTSSASNAPGKTSYVNVSNGIDVVVPVKSIRAISTNGENTSLVNNGATSNGSSFINVINSSTSTTPIIEKIGKYEELLTSGKAILVNEVGNPLKTVEFSGDYDSEDEVVSVDNDIAHSLAFEKTGFGTQSLLELGVLSNRMSLEAAVEAAEEFLNKAVASKGLVPECHPHFMGTYWGVVSTTFCAEIVESADAYVVAGPMFDDGSSVGYSLLLKKEKMITVQPGRVMIGNGPTFGCDDGFLPSSSQKTKEEHNCIQELPSDLRARRAVFIFELRCKALVGGGMERGLSQKGSAGGRGVKEKSVNALNRKVATNGVVPSIIGNSGNIEKEVVSPSLSLKDTNVIGPFPPLPTHGTSSASNALGKTSYVNVSNGIDVVVP
nr:pyruvate decarboxylase 2 [Tanacetum cinerariifolium]